MQKQTQPSQMHIHIVVLLQGIQEREMGEEVTKEGEIVAGTCLLIIMEITSYSFKNIFSFQYLLPHFSHLIFTTTLLCIFLIFRGEITGSARLSVLSKATHWEWMRGSDFKSMSVWAQNPVFLSLIVKWHCSMYWKVRKTVAEEKES